MSEGAVVPIPPPKNSSLHLPQPPLPNDHKQQQKHIRPKKRGVAARSSSTQSSSENSSPSSAPFLVDLGPQPHHSAVDIPPSSTAPRGETRLAGSHVVVLVIESEEKNTVAAPRTRPGPPPSMDSPEVDLVRSILRPSKYNQAPPPTTTTRPPKIAPGPTQLARVSSADLTSPPPPAGDGDWPTPIMVRDVVVERGPASRAAASGRIPPTGSRSPGTAAGSIEGYRPQAKDFSTNTKTPSTQAPPSSKSGRRRIDATTTSPPSSYVDAPPEINIDPWEDTGRECTEPEESDEAPLILNSLSDLIQATGTLPTEQHILSPKDNNAEIVVDGGHQDIAWMEADLSFRCMDPETFAEFQQELCHEQYEVFLGQRHILPDDDPVDEETAGPGGTPRGLSSRGGDPPPPDETLTNRPGLVAKGDDDDHDDDGQVWESDDNSEEEEEAVGVVQPTAFLVLWQSLSQWVTPQAVRYLQRLRNTSGHEPEEATGGSTDWMPPADRSDLGAARCAGLMALMQLHLGRCMLALNRPMDDLALARRRLADLLRCFDYSEPSARFDTPLARAMTCVLLDTVLLDRTVDRGILPELARAVQLQPEEYRYLITSAILNFGHPDEPSCT